MTPDRPEVVAALDARNRSLSTGDRLREAARLRDLAFARAWAAVDRAEPMSPLVQARFVLRRLYPELEGDRLDWIIGELARLEDAGRWAGFTRPPFPHTEQAEPLRASMGRRTGRQTRASRQDRG